MSPPAAAAAWNADHSMAATEQATTAAVSCSNAALDAYAQRVLEKHTNKETNCQPDDSLGPYITSVLRMANSDDVTLLADYEGLMELVQEHCGLDTVQAQSVLQEIATTVVRGQLPPKEMMQMSGASTSSRGSGSNSSSHAFPSMQVLRMALPPTAPPPPIATIDEDEFPTLSQANASTVATKSSGSANAGVLSPQKADSLIPLHLLDDPADGATTPANVETENNDGADAAVPHSDFPPLGAAAAAPPTGKKSGRGRKSSMSKQQPATELAAALFRPARSRQSSIDETSPKLQSSNASSVMTVPDPYIEPEQYEAAASMLLAMNPMDLSPDAAYAASVVAHADVHVAQYVVHAALTAPPVCRHLLQSGCYRSDCQFSHDVEGHTCIFWIRGRCGKGDGCRFLHGFSKALLDDMEIPPPYEEADPYYNANPVLTTPHMYGGMGGYGSNMQSPTLQPVSWMPTSMVTPDSTMMGPSTTLPLEPQFSMTSRVPPTSFANIASQGYSTSSSFTPTWNAPSTTTSSSSLSIQDLPTVRIPQDLWKPHENRDSIVFHIPDPMERYRQVMAMSSSLSAAAAAVNNHDDVVGQQNGGFIDLHFQSTKTFDTVLSQVLPMELQRHDQVWIVTGTGHHVGSKTHQKGGGALESAVLQWLVDEGYDKVFRGRDRNGQGGAILVKR